MLVLILLAISVLLLIIGAAMTVVAAFRVSPGWGFANLFVPGANFVFWYKYWPQSKRGVVILLVGAFLLAFLALLPKSEDAAPEPTVAEPAATPPALATPAPSASESPATAPPESPISEPVDNTISALQRAAREARQAEMQEEKYEVEKLEPLQTGPSGPLKISPNELADYIGSPIELVMKDGRQREGVLESVRGGVAQFQNTVGSGSVSFKVPLSSIKTATLQE